MGDYAFCGCRWLARIDLGHTKVRTLPIGCFDNCVALAVVVLPPVLDAIGRRTFYNCKALGHLSFPVTLTKIDAEALSNTGLTEADFQDCGKLAEIGNGAFRGCNALREIHFSAGLKSCGDYAFAGCRDLAALDFRPCPNLAQVGTQAFDGCSGLKGVQIGLAVAVTGEMFAHCTALELVTVPMGAPPPTGLPANVRVQLGNAPTTADRGVAARAAGYERPCRGAATAASTGTTRAGSGGAPQRDPSDA
jgi:hypothetical protein